MRIRITLRNLVIARRTMASLLAIIAVAVLVLLFVFAYCNSDTIPTGYYQLRTGLGYDDVINLIGMPNDSSVLATGKPIYFWLSSDSRREFHVVFSNGKVEYISSITESPHSSFWKRLFDKYF